MQREDHRASPFWDYPPNAIQTPHPLAGCGVFVLGNDPSTRHSSSPSLDDVPALQSEIRRGDKKAVTIRTRTFSQPTSSK